VTLKAKEKGRSVSVSTFVCVYTHTYVCSYRHARTQTYAYTSAVAEADEFAPDEKVPGGHSLQASDPRADAGLYFPATHSAQVPPSGPDQPASQVQLVTAELPAGDVALVGHALHETADDLFEYLPAEQGIHVVDPGLELSEICNDTLEVSEICNHASR
jgi:hypothetical protein